MSDGRIYRGDAARLGALLDLAAESDPGGSAAAGEDARPAGAPLPPIPVPGYRLVRELSRGGQAVVYEALPDAGGPAVAIKILRQGPFAGSAERARLEREMRALDGVRHPNLVPVLGHGTTPGGWQFLVMKFVRGVALDRDRRAGIWAGDEIRDESGRADDALRYRLKLFVKACDAVAAAHRRGVVHRDLKPANILVDESGEPHVVDFGLARTGLATGDTVAGAPHPTAVRHETVTETGEFLGSLPWASPEQAAGGAGRVDARGDVYSLGVILYQMLTGGQFPYDVSGPSWQVMSRIASAPPAPPRGAGHEVPDALAGVVLKALSKRPADRYADAGELARAVEAAAAGGRPARHRKFGSLRAAAVFVAAAVVAAPLLWSARAGRRPGRGSAGGLAAVAPRPARAPAVLRPLGPPFRVNTFVPGRQYEPSLSANDAGQFVVAWTSRGQEGERDVVCAQFFQPDGSPVGHEIAVSVDAAVLAGNQNHPSVAVDARGGCLVASELTDWEKDASGSGVQYLAYNPASLRRGRPALANEETEGDQGAPVVASNGAGYYVVVWQSVDGRRGTSGIFGRVVDRRAEPSIGREFQVDDQPGRRALRPAVAMRADGSFVVAWESAAASGGPAEVRARSFAACGWAANDSVFVTTTPSDGSCPGVAVAGDGGFAVAWVAPAQAGRHQVRYRRFDRGDGARDAGDLVAGEVMPAAGTRPALAFDAGAGVTVCWTGPLNGGDAVLYRHFDADGVPTAAAPREVPGSGGAVGNPTVASWPGGVVVAWGAPARAGADEDVFAARFVLEGADAPSHPVATRPATPLRPFEPLGPSFQAGPYARDNIRRFIGLAGDASGEFVLAWGTDVVVTKVNAIASRQVLARRFDARGEPKGEVFAVSSPDQTAWDPAVTFDAGGGGDFAIAYVAADDADVARVGTVLARRYNAAGVPETSYGVTIGPPFGFRQDTPAPHLLGRTWGAVWHRYNGSLLSGDVFARRSEPVSGEWPDVKVNVREVGGVAALTVAVDPLGYNTVVWSGYGRLMGRRYDPDQINIGDEFFVSPEKPVNAQYPSAAADRHGNVLVVWKETRDAKLTLSASVFARALDRTGTLGEVVTVHQRPYHAKDEPAMAMNGDGLAVVVWTYHDPQTGRGALLARRYTAAGVPLDEREQEFVALPSAERAHPRVAIDARGDVTVAWQEEVASNQVVVRARRFAGSPRGE